MTWTGAPEALPTARIAALAPSLQPSEQRVAETIAADVARAIDMTAQELAAVAGVGRASVVRTAQSLGYEGYPQLRVALAREGVATAAPAEALEGSLGVVQAAIDRFSRALPHASAGLTEASVDAFVRALDEGRRVIVSANGLSAPLGYDVALRLASAGRPVEYMPDALAQRIAAGQLRAGDVLLAISGSGSSGATIAAVEAALQGGATALALTAFSRSPLVSRATVALVVPSPVQSFQNELLQTSRAGMALVIEALVEALAAHRGPRAHDARDAMLAAISDSLRE
ncbi:MurR/RpiR family transcriptional regulator [Demequina capsici]|uniref:MurR/RpiR family transcriptional regulator n=1 Tax=Demequina capsici TaxID=3075620 RepID=A0AA96FBE1_9MICO|nr:MurR/RpiR family transcriptional regulator [Demequina sp. OYTSA14]WNM25496.1 MurR/RpiR family transcriptional regulator [Demequina sp. OYTSA14]